MKTKPHQTMGCIIGATLLLGVNAMAWAEPAVDKRQIERGRYLVATSGCNDCHTPGYPEAGGKLPAAEWLTGNPVGFQGPWGTTYPANLRLTVQGLSPQEWLAKTRNPLRPPMPWFNLRDMSEQDVLAIYAFISDLGPRGEKAPAFVAPGQQVVTPYIEFVPKNLPALQAANAHHAQ